MSFQDKLQRFLPVLFFLSAGVVSSTALAQTATTGGDAASDAPKVILVACGEGKAMLSSDGGDSWRFLDAIEAEQARQALENPALLRRTVVSGTTSATVSPNPTSGMTQIRYMLEQPESVTITLHTTTGIEVLRTDDLPLHPGAQISTIDASSVPSGSYFFRVRNASGEMVAAGSLAVTR